MSSVFLVLENGQVFEGQRFGAEGDVTGELVFTTGMTGYLETLTDPSYYGQIVVQTFPLIGNYGVIPEDFESEGVHLSAYIVREWCEEPSNFRCRGTVDEFLKREKIIGICGVDTRELTRIIREHGVMNARIQGERPKDPRAMASEISRYSVENAVMHVTCKREGPLSWDNAKGEGHPVVLMDFGAKRNIERELIARGCRVLTVPADTAAEEIMALKPDGLMLSNGPGDPMDNRGIIAELRKLFDSNIPTFGICLGHQLLALAAGARTVKLKYGHRGANQPVKDLRTDAVYITSQNHGYAVDSRSLPENAKECFVNMNDGTCEGIEYTDRPVFSVQFHPEACAGPLDTRYLFDQFLRLMDGASGKETYECR